jgi:hypothetical protein
MLLRNIAYLCIAAREPRRAAAGGARAMLRYPIRAACRLLVDRACGCGTLWNESGEFEPGSGATCAEPYDDVIGSTGAPW